MMARFPLWRTTPAGVATTGVLPFLTGIIAVLAAFPAFGFAEHFIAEGVFGEGPNVPRNLRTVLMVISLSPLFSWPLLITAVPLSAWAAHYGYAGWCSAACAGLVGSYVMVSILEGALRFNQETLLFTFVGLPAGLFYWLAIRLLHPAALGFDRKGTP